MSDSLDSWMKVDKEVRRLQPEELAEAKGMPKEWQLASQKNRTVWHTIISDHGDSFVDSSNGSSWALDEIAIVL